MQVNVVFGSKSDKDVFEPLCNGLGELPGVKVLMEVCSAHREPDRLRKWMQEKPCDLYVAGAGLAAHLPGVVASQTKTPVIGIPCLDVLRGMDALLSVLQMPKGVPVMTSGVSKVESVINFVKWYAANRDRRPVFRVIAPEWADKMTQQLQEPLEKIGWDFVKRSSDVDHPPGVFPVVLADLFAPVANPQGRDVKTTDGAWLGAPVFAQPPYQGDLDLIGQVTAAGGLWVGVNNITNLQISLLQLWPMGSAERDLMNELRGGQKQSVG